MIYRGLRKLEVAEKLGLAKSITILNLYNLSKQDLRPLFKAFWKIKSVVNKIVVFFHPKMKWKKLSLEFFRASPLTTSGDNYLPDDLTEDGWTSWSNLTTFLQGYRNATMVWKTAAAEKKCFIFSARIETLNLLFTAKDWKFHSHSCNVNWNYWSFFSRDSLGKKLSEGTNEEALNYKRPLKLSWNQAAVCFYNDPTCLPVWKWRQLKYDLILKLHFVYKSSWNSTSVDLST